MNASKKVGLFLLLFGIVSAVLAGRAAAAVEDYVPASAIGILKVSDLESHYERLKSGPLLNVLRGETGIPDIAHGLAQAEFAIEEFERTHNVDVEDVLRQVLGREFAIAPLPDDTAVFVALGHDPESLRAAVEVLLSIERESGKLQQLTTSEYKGVEVHSCSLPDKVRYHVVTKGVVAVSEHLGAVEKVIDVMSGDEPALSSSPQYREAAAMTPDGALVSAYIDAVHLQPLAEMLQSQLPHAPNPVARFAASRIAEIVPLMRFAVFTARVERDLEAQLSVVYKGRTLPTSLRSILPPTGSKLDILRLAPASAALACARNVDHEAIWNSFMETVLRSDAAAADKIQEKFQTLINMVNGVQTQEQFFDEVGGQMALIVVPARPGGTLPGAAGVLELHQTTHIPVALKAVIGSVVLFAEAESGTRAFLEDGSYQGVALTTVRLNLPPPMSELSPTLCVVDGYMVVSSSVDTAEQIIDAARSGTAAGGEGVEGTIFSTARLNVRVLTAMLDQHREFLVRNAVQKEGKSPEQAARDIAALRTVLSFFESVELVGAFVPGQTDLVATVRFAGLQP